MIKRKVRSGYSMTTVYYSRNLSGHPSAQCGIRDYVDGAIDFVSYTTTVISIDKNGWLKYTGLYSPTTRKQISWFLHECAPMITYQMIKQAYDNGVQINIYTGEIK